MHRKITALSKHLDIPIEKLQEWSLYAKRNHSPFIPYLINIIQIPSKEIYIFFKKNSDLPGIEFIPQCQNMKDTNSQYLDFITKNHMTIINNNDDCVEIAIFDTEQALIKNEIEFLFNKPVKFLLSSYQAITFSIHQHKLQYLFNKALQSSKASEDNTTQLVNACITNSVLSGASDIHFEPYDNEFIIRHRVNGVLIPMFSLPCQFHNFFINRIKILSLMDITEKRKPQDGRFTFNTDFNSTRDCRVNSCPTIHGEKLVLRILNPNQKIKPLSELGLPALRLDHVRTRLSQPQGLILITGPTGSGKSQTLYTFINHIKSPAKNITTIENPVEIKMHAITQINSHHDIGLNFTSLLRSLLRQDPDIIMIGEIRDSETAEIAMSAAQTGHLVFSTLHTNNATETIDRFKHLGIQSYNLSNGLSLIIAQRLIRILCHHCKKLITSSPHAHYPELKTIDHHFSPIGCSKCHDGYSHRQAIFEVLPIDNSIKKIIATNKLHQNLPPYLLTQSHQTLWDHGVSLVSDGQTSIDEFFRIISPECRL